MAALGHGLQAVGAAWPHNLRPKRAALLTISAVFIVGVAWGASGLGSSMRAQFLTNSDAVPIVFAAHTSHCESPCQRAEAGYSTTRSA